MQGDEIEIGQVVTPAEMREAGILQLRATTTGSRQLLGKGRLQWIEIIAPPCGGRCRVKVGRQALPETQFAGGLDAGACRPWKAKASGRRAGFMPG
jgi:hypothetical protein